MTYNNAAHHAQLLPILCHVHVRRLCASSLAPSLLRSRQRLPTTPIMRQIRNLMIKFIAFLERTPVQVHPQLVVVLDGEVQVAAEDPARVDAAGEWFVRVGA